MAEFKKLSDVEVVETPMDTANVLIEEDGVIKKAPKSAVGTVNSVNGVVPDENGNVTIETAASWNDLKDKPFYEEVSYIPMVEEQTVTFTDNGNSTKAIATLEGNYLSWGETYVLSFDGAEYTFTVDCGSDEEWGTFKIGDAYVDVYTDLRIQIGSISYIGEHTVSVTKIISNVKKLDDKYLPDTLPKFNKMYDGLVGFWGNEVRSTCLLTPKMIYNKYNNSDIVHINSYNNIDLSYYHITKIAFDFGIISKNVDIAINATNHFNISSSTGCMLFFGKVVIIIQDDNVQVINPTGVIETVESIQIQYTDNTPVNTSYITIYAQ